MQKQKVNLAFRKLKLKKSIVINLSSGQAHNVKGGGGTIVLQPKPTTPAPPQPPVPPPDPKPDTRDSREAGCTIGGN